MEGQADAVPGTVGRLQQFGRLLRRRTELAAEIVDRRPSGGRQPDDDHHITGMAGFSPDLRQFVGMIDHEVPHPMLVIGCADGAALLHRMHEIAGGIRQPLGNDGDFRHRRRVEMADAAIVQRIEEHRFRVAFDGIEDRAWKSIDKAPRRLTQYMRTHAIHRLFRHQSGDHGSRIGKTAVIVSAYRKWYSVRA